MIGILVIAHEPLASALVQCTRHVFGRLPEQVAALDVVADEDPAQALAAARALAARINDGSGLIVLTDLYGATPSRIAVQLADPMRVLVFAGVNLPMLLKAMNYRRKMQVNALAAQLQAAMADSVGLVAPLTGRETQEPEEDTQ